MYHSGAYSCVVVLSIAYTFAFPCAVSALSLIKNKNNGKRIMVSSTRKSTRLSSKAVAVLPESTAPSPTPAKKETTTKKKTKKESVTKAASTATKSKKKKETVAVIVKAKKAVAKKVVAPTAVKKAAADTVVGSEGKKIVIIEACKQ